MMKGVNGYPGQVSEEVPRTWENARQIGAAVQGQHHGAGDVPLFSFRNSGGLDGGGVPGPNMGGFPSVITGDGIITSGLGNGFGSSIIRGNNNIVGSIIQCGTGNVIRLVDPSPCASFTGPHLMNGHLAWCKGGGELAMNSGNGRCVFGLFANNSNSQFQWTSDQNTIRAFRDGMELIVQPRPGTRMDDFKVSLSVAGWVEISLPL